MDQEITESQSNVEIPELPELDESHYLWETIKNGGVVPARLADDMCGDVIINGDAKIPVDKASGLQWKLNQVFTKDFGNRLDNRNYLGKNIAIFIKRDSESGNFVCSEKAAQELLSDDALEVFENSPKVFLQNVKNTASKDSKGITYHAYFLGLKSNDRKDVKTRGMPPQLEYIPRC